MLLLVAILLAGVAAYLGGLHENFDPEALRELVAEAGVWGPVLFVLLFGLEGLGVPGIVFVLTALALWPPWLAFLLNWLGAQVAGVVGFTFARTVGRDWIAQHLPERVRGFEQQVVERGVQTVIVVRLFFFLAPWAHWALGLSPVSWRAFLLGSAIGYVPLMLAISLGGAALFEWLAGRPVALWLGLGAVVVAAVVVRRLLARRRGLVDSGQLAAAPRARSDG